MLESLMLVALLGGAATPEVDPDALQYQAAGRRDPFVNPTAELGFSHKHDHCGAGLKAFFTSELTLRGTVRTNGVFTAAVSTSDGRTYFAHIGQPLCDGVIVEITEAAAIVQQDMFDRLNTESARKLGSRTVRLELPR
jgi:Tfp pilus assembly protein PilP